MSSAPGSAMGRLATPRRNAQELGRRFCRAQPEDAAATLRKLRLLKSHAER
jgi:hypothetical protein